MRRTGSGGNRVVEGAASARTPARRTLVLWGERGSGKSGVVGALRSEATRTVGDRWAADLADTHQEVVDYAESASLALRLRDVKDTPIRRPDRPVTLAVKRFAGSREQEAAQLTVLDPRGQLATRAFDADARDIMHALATADGIIWLIETQERGRRSAGHECLLEQIVAVLDAAEAAQLELPVAIVLSKVDRLSTTEMRRAMNAPEEALREQLGDATFGWLLASCPRLRCFALSAAGSVRNAARPVGLAPVFDWFSAEWRRGEREVRVVRSRERRSARVARVRRKAPIAALAVAAAAVVVFAGGALARRLTDKSATWTTSAGGIAPQSVPALPAPVEAPPPSAAPPAPRADERDLAMPAPSLVAVVAAYDRGDMRTALRLLAALDLAATDTGWFAVDSMLALAALRGVDEALRGPTPDVELLRLVVTATTGAIGRAHPGTYLLAPLSVARAEACIGGRLECPADRLREDLAWALLLGSPVQQDLARRLRAAWLADTNATSS